VSSGPDIDQLCAVLAECITAIGAATAAYEAAEAATRRDHDIVLAVAGNNPGRTLSRSLADLEDAIKHIRRERASREVVAHAHRVVPVKTGVRRYPADLE
jgi:phage terminase large subunit-like protein